MLHLSDSFVASVPPA